MTNFDYVPAIHPTYAPLKNASAKPDDRLVDLVKVYANSADSNFKLQMTMMLGLLGRYTTGGNQSSVSAGLANLELVMTKPENHQYLMGAIAMTGQDYECNMFIPPEQFYEQLCTIVNQPIEVGSKVVPQWFKKSVSKQEWDYTHVARTGQEQMSAAASEAGQSSESTANVTAMDRLLYLFSLTEGSMEDRVDVALKATSEQIDGIYVASMRYMQKNMHKYDDLWGQVLAAETLTGNTSIAARLGLEKSEYAGFKRTVMKYDGGSGRSAASPTDKHVEAIAENLSDKMWQSLMTVDGYKALSITIFKVLELIPELSDDMSQLRQAYENGDADTEIRDQIEAWQLVGLNPEHLKYALTSAIDVMTATIPKGRNNSLGIDYLSVADGLLKTAGAFDMKTNPAQIMGGVMQLIQSTGLNF
jgi:hypothetical protein